MGFTQTLRTEELHLQIKPEFPYQQSIRKQSKFIFKLQEAGNVPIVANRYIFLINYGVPSSNYVCSVTHSLVPNHTFAIRNSFTPWKHLFVLAWQIPGFLRENPRPKSISMNCGLPPFLKLVWGRDLQDIYAAVLSLSKTTTFCYVCDVLLQQQQKKAIDSWSWIKGVHELPEVPAEMKYSWHQILEAYAYLAKYLKSQ